MTTTADFAGQVVVITGASAGIGAALAEEVARRGASVVLAARRAERLAEVAGRLGADRALPVATDVTRREDVQRLLEAALARFGRVDVWVNNAGRGISQSVAELTDEDVDAMVRDNVKSALYGMQAVLPHLKARGEGAIVNVSSMLGRTPLAPARSAYSAAKAALNSLTETLRLELAASHPGVRVQLVLPGVVATEFGVNARGGGIDSRAIPGGQTAEEVARVIADGIRSRRPDIYTRADGLQQVLGYLQRLAGGV